MAGPLCFGRYETLFRIASGGMAEVFAARVRGDLGFERLVAVKRIVPHLAEDEAFVRMFLDEARLAAHVSSPHVVQTHDLGRADDGSLYIAMELVLGVTLAELIAAAAEHGERLPVGVALEIAAQAADGLHDAHEARTPDGIPLEIVHRDVSPQNVLVGEDGRVKVTDFGIARAARGRLAHTEHGQLKGKFAYFSPEQSRAAALDRRSDVFALGIVTWEMLAGERLFARATPADTIVAVRRAQVPDLCARRPDVPPEVAAVIRTALAREPADRPASAGELALRLRTAARAARLETTSAEVASYVRGLDLVRLAQLRDRIRAALERPDVRTLPDIEIAPGAPVTSTAVVDRAPGHARPADVPAVAIAEPGDTTTEEVPARSDHAAPTVLAPGRARSRRWIAIGVVSAVSLGAIGYASSLAAREAARGSEPASLAPTLGRPSRSGAGGALEERSGAPTRSASSDPAAARASSEREAFRTDGAAAPAAEPAGEAGSEREGAHARSPAGGDEAGRPSRARPSRRSARRADPPPRRAPTEGREAPRTVGAPAGLEAFERGVRR